MENLLFFLFFRLYILLRCFFLGDRYLCGEEIFELMITILCEGRLRDKSLRAVLDEYLVRMEKYGNVQYMESSDLGKSIASLKEVTIICLDERGVQKNSVDFSLMVQKLTLSQKNIVFVIGEAYGIPAKIMDMASVKVSLSLMTMPTQLVRVVFAEQLYRAFTIIRGEPYHKE